MAKKLVVEGGRSLYGEVVIPAAKNSVLPLLAASILCEEPVQLCAVPRLSDVEHALALLRVLGCTAQWIGQSVLIDTKGISDVVLPQSLTEKMRASVLFLGPLLARIGRVETGMSGGCSIGARPIDIHLDGLVQMGAHIVWKEKHLVLEAPRGLHAVDYTLRFPSVGATETLLLAAVCTKGKTTLRGVAREPEIVDLAAFLCACGGDVRGAGTSVIEIHGGPHLQGAFFTPLPDRIVAATVACGVATAGGAALLKNANSDTFAPVLHLLEQAGCVVQAQQDAVYIARTKRLCGVGRVFTGVYPAFPTDAAPLLAAPLLCASSASSIEDAVFENRFSCAEGFSAMGAKIKVEGRTLSIAPRAVLQEACVSAPDLRGGAALVLAALGARGRTVITQAEYIARGYEDISRLFTSLGGKIVERKEI